MNTAVKVTDLAFDYPAHRALNSISFGIEKGSVTALVGPNGAGKTTLLRCIAALEQPTTGSIAMFGVSTSDQPRLCHRRLGFLADEIGLYEKLTVEQSLLYAAWARGIYDRAASAAVKRVFSALALEDLRRRFPGELSRGQRQRLAIGQAVIHQPDLLLLDEPASGLDPEARSDLAFFIKKIRESGTTVIVSSHILSELEDYSTDMLTIDNGNILGQEKVAASFSAQSLLEIRVASDPGKAFERIRNMPGLEAARKDGDFILLPAPVTGMERHALLGRLIGQGLDICSYSERVIAMEDIYLSQVRKKGGTANV